jgi:hypothetical protein
MIKTLKRYNQHHYIHIIETLDRLAKFINDNIGGEKSTSSLLVREAEEDLIKKYKKRHPKWAKEEKKFKKMEGGK